MPARWGCMQVTGIVYPIALAVAFVADLLFSGAWMPWYFQFGVVLFRQEVAVEGTNTLVLNAEMLQSHFDTVFRGQRMMFRQLTSNTIGIREKLFSFGPSTFRYTPVMHALLTFDRGESKVTIRGVANWTFLVLTLIVVLVFVVTAVPHSALGLVAIPVYLSFPLIIYVVQRRRYIRILRVASGT
jgi:hypothetical protein